MKAIIFGLAILCALPGCCGWMKCNKNEEKKEKKEMKSKNSGNKKMMKDSNK